MIRDHTLQILGVEKQANKVSVKPFTKFSLSRSRAQKMDSLDSTRYSHPHG
jgi:hypothetical protein